MPYTKNQITKVIEDGRKVRITHQDRMSFGKFVKLADHDDMFKKNYVRFVSGANLDAFEGNSAEDPEQTRKGSLNLTKLYDYRFILLIEQF